MRHRDMFKKLTLLLEEEKKQRLADRSAAIKAFDSALIQSAKALKPGSRVRVKNVAWARKVLGDGVMPLLMEHRARAESVDGVHGRRIEKLVRILKTLATKIRVCAGDETFVFAAIWVSSYSSQGLGAESYARNAAELRADIARLAEIPVEVIRVGERPVRFEVRVQLASETDLDILNMKRGPDLREQVRLCWARGVNPRVYNPYLPMGIEEKLGLDRFGGTK